MFAYVAVAVLRKRKTSALLNCCENPFSFSCVNRVQEESARQSSYLDHSLNKQRNLKSEKVKNSVNKGSERINWLSIQDRL